MCQLKIESVAKSFDSPHAILESIEFSVAQGEFLVILGPSGCGKTTLLRIIAGLENPDSGRVYIAGKDVTELEPKYRDIAMVFQNYALYPHMTVFDNLAFALKVRKTPKEQLKQTVTSTAELLGLAAFLDRKPKQLSGGQRQRVALGRAIVRDPSLFLFDEPLSNLDAELRSQMRFELLSLHRQIEATSVYVTHDQTEAMSLADNIIILNNGKQTGPTKPRELYDNPPDTFIAGFLGNPGMNLLEAAVDDTGKMLKIGDLPLFESGVNLAPGAKVMYGFRPENCRLDTDGQIPVKVVGAEDTGKEFIIELRGPGQTRLYCLSKTKYPHGENLRLNVNKACFFNSDTGKALS
ncbi:MAG: ATP-binding cassette domain-containing protein [candidate division Zixibacteria bacterium]|nr:ATP-binding cassette domain-containing protein [candidate division Zixibacteria bacterium]